MRDLARQHQALLPLIDGYPVQYLDIPIHDNIGDQLIYLGTLRFLRENRISVSAISSAYNYSPRKDRSILLLHGGGNLGDLYQHHELFREKIISENLHRRIIILPQSIYFQERDAFDRAQRVMSSHHDLHICARDKRSLEIARRLSRHTILMPDMAHRLYPVIGRLSRTTKPATLSLRRTDNETAHSAYTSILGFATQTDWPELIGYRHRRRIRRAVRVLKALTTLGLAGAISRPFSKWWECESNELAARAIDLFSKHSLVITDRLHAHILACLMDIPSKVQDNVYGKNLSYVESWTYRSSLTQLEAPT